MKFSDIVPLIRSGEYEVDITLKTLELTLKQMDEDCGLELNPDFQRGHVWTEKQQVAYVEFLLRGGVTSKVIYFNSPSYGKREENCDLPDTILCVDGLQRLTACLRFVRNEIQVFGHYCADIEGSLRVVQGLKFNINCLSTRAEVLQWYLEFNTGGTVHTKEEIARVRELLELEMAKK